MFEPFAHRGYAKPRIQIMELEKRWGSLTASGTLVLSRDLVRAPVRCIDYVIVHELCHLEHPNHEPGFRRLLEHTLPDADNRKVQLEQILS